MADASTDERITYFNKPRDKGGSYDFTSNPVLSLHFERDERKPAEPAPRHRAACQHV